LLDDNSGLTEQFAGYSKLFADPKARIRSAQVRAVRSVNRELVRLNRQIGSAIIVRQEKEVSNKNQRWD